MACREDKLTNDVVIILLHRELNLSTGVCVAKTQDGTIDISRLELLDQLLTVLAETAQEIRDHFARFGSLAIEVGESSLDASR